VRRGEKKREKRRGEEQGMECHAKAVIGGGDVGKEAKVK